MSFTDPQPNPMQERSALQSIREVKPNTFIFEKEAALPVDVCLEIVRRFEAREEDQYVGRLGQGAARDQSVKKTTDIAASGNEKWKDIDRLLFQSLGRALLEFREMYPYFKGPFKDMGYNIQRYQPGEYYQWHIDSGSHDFANRQLVALWYLNDVEGPGGTTDFLTQGLKIRPEEGKLVLFPPFWTHEHRSAPLQKGVKYIATTWVVFA